MAALAGHYRRAHRRRQGHPLVPATPRLERLGCVQGKMIDPPSIRLEVVSLRPESALSTPTPGEVRIVPRPLELPVPDWLSPSLARRWPGMSLEQRRTLEAEHQSVSAGPAFLARPLQPEVPDEVLLNSQFYALMAVWTRITGGVAMEREKAAYPVALAEYKQNFLRIRAERQKKALSR